MFFLLDQCLLSFLRLKLQRLCLYFQRKFISIALPWGTWNKDAPLRGWRREKSSAPGGIRTHNISVILRHCATTTAQVPQWCFFTSWCSPPGCSRDLWRCSRWRSARWVCAGPPRGQGNRFESRRLGQLSWPLTCCVRKPPGWHPVAE